MKLLNLELENYRRFVGKHVINFASDKEKNITLIRAENGAGKTGILMSLLFGLFGLVKYEQFKIDNDDDVMVSRQLLRESGSSSYSTVSISFLDENEKYKITRTITARNSNGNLYQDDENIIVKLYKNGILHSEDVTKIDSFMNNLIGEHIRGFLFFDGVRYTELFKTETKAAKRELKRIIEKMLNIGDLDEIIKVLQYNKSRVTRSSNSTKYDEELAKHKNEEIKIQNQIKNNNKQIDVLENENLEVSDLIAKTQTEISQNEEYIDIINKIKTLEEKHKNLENDRLNKYEIIKGVTQSHLQKLVHYKIGPEVKEEFNNVSSSSNNNLDIINQILKSNNCLCGKNLDKKDIQYFEKFRNEILNSQNYSNSASFISKEVVDIISDDSSVGVKFKNDYSDLENLNTELIKLDEEIQELSKSVPIFETSASNVIKSHSSNLENLGELKNRLKTNKEKIEELEKNIKKLEQQIKELDDKINILEQKIAILSNTEDEYNFYDKIHNNLKELREEYLKEAQQKISDKADEYFQKLLSEDDSVAIKELKISTDYSIKAYNQRNQEIFGDLSAGQKLLAAMAFTMGLTAVAANAKPTTNFPLVMDTPMSNLDGGNRNRLINLMPEVVQQWILTPMDTELSNREIDYFHKTNKVGNVYEIVKDKEDSVIMEINDILELKGNY